MTDTNQPSAKGENRRFVRITVLTALCASLSGCGKLSDAPLLDSTSRLVSTNTLEIPKSASERKLAVQRGRDAFYNYGCWHCHAAGDEEAPGMRNELAMGPDLADVGNRLAPKALLQSILEPSAVIAEPREKHMAEGISLMPVFNDPQAKDDIRDIVLFLHQCKLSEIFQPTMVKMTDENFFATTENFDGLVLLDFWAEWCFACLELNPVLEELATEYQGRIKFCKIEVDENPMLVEKYVPEHSFPCLVLIKDGKVLGRKHGVDPDAELKPFVKDWLNKFAG